jgi:hypothetical protein
MKLNAYVIRDKKAGFYNNPFYLHNDDIAKRTMTDLVNDPESQINHHPEDFSIWKVGVYDNEIALFEPCELECIAYAHHLPINVKITPQSETE